MPTISSKSIGLSVVLAVHNEEKHLAACLDSIKDIADEIIVIDGESTDSTVKIARRYKARVISTSNKPNFHINKNLGIDAARRAWILQLDADEIVSKSLKNQIIKIINAPGGPNGYWIPRLNYFLGRPLRKGGQYPDYTLRLYRNGSGRLPAKDVHEQAVVEGETAYLNENLLHFNAPDFESYLLRHNRYTSLIAANMLASNISYSPATFLSYCFIKPLAEFVLLYFRHKGFVDGFPGFVFALFSGLRFPIAYIKFWQIKYHPHK